MVDNITILQKILWSNHQIGHLPNLAGSLLASPSYLRGVYMYTRNTQQFNQFFILVLFQFQCYHATKIWKLGVNQSQQAVMPLKIPNRPERPRAAKLHEIRRLPSAARVSFPARAIPKSHTHYPQIWSKPTGKNKRSGTCVCKSDGSTNLSGRLRLGNGHGVSHVPRRRVGEAPRHGRRATALYPAERSQGLAAGPA